MLYSRIRLSTSNSLLKEDAAHLSGAMDLIHASTRVRVMLRTVNPLKKTARLRMFSR